jgi:hypothetical protein
MTDWFSIAIWSLVGTWLLVVGTLVLMYWQTRTSQHLNSANAVMELRERFDSGRMRAARRHLAEKLLKGNTQDVANVEVLTFFELVGTLTHRHVLDDDLVWEAFGTWVEAYYWAVRNPDDLVARVRREYGDPLVFHEFEWLHGRIAELDRQKAGPTSNPEAATWSHRILGRELQLESV